jgi:outer membrane protein assembly factor BamD (BamD/ComL family)
MSHTTSGKHYRTILVTSICSVAIAATALGCAYEAGSEHSVRFNPYRTEKEFGRLPPLPKYTVAEANRLFSWDRNVDGGDVYEEYDNQTKGIDKLWDEAVESEFTGQLVEARRLLQQYLDRTQPQRCSRWLDPAHLQERRNTATDKLDALSEIEHGASNAAVKEYLAARSEYDGAHRQDEVLKHLEQARHDVRLTDNADYLSAALRREGDEQAVRDFERLGAKYPRSEKREAALYMAATLTMKLSRSYQVRRDPRALKYTCDDYDCRDSAWHRSRAAFERLMREYPNGRYYSDARGQLGYLSLLAADTAGALVEYYRLLSDRRVSGKVEALFSLCLVRHRADDSDMDRVEKTLEHEPAAALAYAYHNIYNYAFRPDSDRGFYEDYNGEHEAEQVSEQRHELERTASFATRMMNRFPSSAVGAGFIVRVAEADLELDMKANASALARRALVMGAKDDIRAEALWIAGVSEFRRRQYSTARQAFITLIAENPNDRYTEGARRQLAMLEEDTGNIERALDQYLALDYRDDIAYFVDVLMTPEQLATYVEKHPSLQRHDELMYALGIRYLRDRRWNDARTAFAKVKALGRNVDDEYLNKINAEPWRKDRRDETPKEREFDSSIRGIRPYWIAEDVRTANELERLEHEVEAAPTDEGKAEALYQVASYQYERSLLFYNPLEWRGARHELLYDLDQRGAFRKPNESQMLLDYMQKHDMASSSLPIFLEVMRRFPNTRAARDALFTAAVCHERLHEYNGYWREIYSNEGHAGPRMVTYLDVRAVYPGYRFPRGTSGWEPSTRTVNGGPGWEKPPRPKPRPSRWARVERLANCWSTESLKLWNRLLADIEFLLKQVWLSIVAAVNWVGHWLWIIATCCWLWFLWRRAREARALMSETLSCCKPRPLEERLNPDSLLALTPSASVFKKYLNQDIRAAWLESAYDLEYKMNQVVRNKRGVSLAAFYLATHGLFVVLLLRLLVNW